MFEIGLNHVSKSFDNKKVLKDISFSVREGEMITLLGPSGCGKSTTLKIIAGLLTPEQGDVLFNGRSVLNIPVAKRGAVIVFQEYLLFPHMTVEDNIGFGLKMAKMPKNKRAERVKKMLQLVQLEACSKKFPNELSGGQKQRVAIARALAIEPQVLLLDEPFSNLDIRLRETMRSFICELQKKLKITTILVTHDKEEALMVSDRIAVMLDGKIVQFSAPMELYETPISPRVADFLGEKNYISGNIDNGVFHCCFGKYKVHTNKQEDVKAMIKPEDVEMMPLDHKRAIQGRVKQKRYTGDRMHYIIISKEMEIKCITTLKSVFEIGEEVSLDILWDKVVFYQKNK